MSTKRQGNVVSKATAAPLAVGIKEAARMAGIGQTKFKQHLRAGDGPRTFRLGGRRLVRVATLDAWLAKLEKDASA